MKIKVSKDTYEFICWCVDHHQLIVGNIMEGILFMVFAIFAMIGFFTMIVIVNG